jgi:hypothetical protein
MRKFVLLYLLALLLSILAIAGLAEWGQALYPQAAVAVSAPTAPAAPALSGRLQQPLALLLLQMGVVIVAARLLGRAIRRFGQPAVIGEILAGVLLGPSLLGLVWPQALAFLFPPAALAPLQLLAQLGVLLFMFAVGLELDLGELRQKARAALVVSHASMVLPFLLGLGLALALFPLLAPAGVPFRSFALFFGIAMSITAFPVLARILEERRMIDTPVGRSAIASAAVGDASAWCLLALVVALAQARGPASALWTAALALGLVLALHLLLKPLLLRLFAARLAADHRHPRAVRRLPRRHRHAARQGLPPAADGQAPGLQHGRPAAAVLRPDRFAHPDRPAAGRPGLAAVRVDRAGGGGRQARRHPAGGALDRLALARGLRPRRADEHPRPDGADRAQPGLRPRHPVGAGVHHAGDHGPAHHLHGRTAADFGTGRQADRRRCGHRSFAWGSLKAPHAKTQRCQGKATASKGIQKAFLCILASLREAAVDFLAPIAGLVYFAAL